MPARIRSTCSLLCCLPLPSDSDKTAPEPGTTSTPSNPRDPPAKLSGQMTVSPKSATPAATAAPPSAETSTRAPPTTFPALTAQFPAQNFVQGAGVAIFHVRSARVVVCSAEDRRGRTYFFLPKGRRDAGEEVARGAEREGFEESGYRNRLLPLPLPHRQPQPYPHTSSNQRTLVCEPIWTQLLPLRPSIQYLVHWYIAETLSPDVEKGMPLPDPRVAYTAPPPYPQGLKLSERLRLEPEGYEPVHHEGTGVDEEERQYKSYLIPVAEAVEKLGRGGLLADVVARGWAAIQNRLAMEGDVVHIESPEEMQ